MMKEKFNETQVLLEAIKCQNNISSSKNNNTNAIRQQNFCTMIPVVHNFSFIRPADETNNNSPSGGGYGSQPTKQKKICVKIFGRTRSQSGNRNGQETEGETENVIEHNKVEFIIGRAK